MFSFSSKTFHPFALLHEYSFLRIQSEYSKFKVRDDFLKIFAEQNGIGAYK